MTALLALMMVVIRKNRHVSMLPAACLSAFACAVAVLPLVDPVQVGATDLALLAPPTYLGGAIVCAAVLLDLIAHQAKSHQAAG